MVMSGSRGKIYLVAENRVLKINSFKIETPQSATEVFFGPEPGEIIGLAGSTSSSFVLINVKNRGLFAYKLQGGLLWSAGPVLYQFGYRQGCRKNVSNCYFTSVPVIDQCEASIYISNTEGELYALAVRSPHFKWIQDISSVEKTFTVTPGNNGKLYVLVPSRALLLALDVSSGNVLWQRGVGPLSTADYAPVVDSHGWISIGSLDGFLYSFSPTGVLKRFSNAATLDYVIQASPVLDCTGYAVYISQTEMVGKIIHTVGEHPFVSAMKPKGAIFTLFLPASGSMHWSERYPGQFFSLLSQSDLQHFVLDEKMLLAFASASNIGNPIPCRSSGQKLATSCSQRKPKRLSVYTGNEKAILLFLLFESMILIMLAALVRFCCIFWRKKKLQGQDLGKFLEKRRSLQIQKKAFDRSITELGQKASDEAVANEVHEKLDSLVKERETIQRKLSTTYSLGRDKNASNSKSLLPLYEGKWRRYPLQGAEKGSVTIFRTLSDSSSEDSSSDNNIDYNKWSGLKGKAKAPADVGSPSNDKNYEKGYVRSLSASASKGFVNPLHLGLRSNEQESKMRDDGNMTATAKKISGSIRRRTLSSTN